MSNRQNRPRALRPMSRAAGQSLSLEEAAGLIGELSAAQVEEDVPAKEEAPDYSSEYLADYVPGNDDEGEIQGQPVRQSVQDAAEVLFGPHASLNSAEDKHAAAWTLYLELSELQLNEPDPGLVQGDLEALQALHADNGNGYCLGCGQNPDGGYVRQHAECPTMAILEGRDE